MTTNPNSLLQQLGCIVSAAGQDVLLRDNTATDESSECLRMHVSMSSNCNEMGGLQLEIARWSRDVFVLMPGAVYGGNRFPSFSSAYPPVLSARSPRDPDRSLQISDVPRLQVGPGQSFFRQTSAEPSFPALGCYFPEQRIALWVATAQECASGPFTFELRESADRSSAVLQVLVVPRRDAPVEAEILLCLSSCDSVQRLFNLMLPLRNRMTAPPRRHRLLPFSAAWEILEEKYNRENWIEESGYYAVGTEPVRRKHVSQIWQMGWTGGMLAAHAMILAGSELSRGRALRNFDFVFPLGQAPSGFFYGMSDGREWMGDHFGDPKKPWHLIRKSADGLYFMLGSLLHLRGIRRTDLIKSSWETGLKKCADAFVRLWDENGQFGQFVDHDTGGILVANSTSGALVPAALLRAAEYFPDSEQDYRRVAAESGRYFVDGDLRSGVTSGGPGDAAQCPDSESIAGLLESLISLYGATGDGGWLGAARDAAVQLASWVVPYDFSFPPESTFAKLHMRTCGTVLANVQNKHSAPGLCTHSGIALFHLFRATGEALFMDLLRDIAHALPQFLSRSDRLIPFGIPYCQPDDPGQTWLNPGWMNERVNMSQWGPDEYPGELFYCSCWPEVSLMLSVAELPGVYARKDTRQIWCLDHIQANWTGDETLTLRNPTEFPACVRVVLDYKLPSNSASSKNASILPRGKVEVRFKNAGHKGNS